MLISGLEDRIVFSSTPTQQLRGIEGILMSGENEKPSENYIYVATPELAEKALRQYDGRSTFILFIAGKFAMAKEKMPSALNLISVDAALPELYNTLYHNFIRYCQWKSKLRQIPAEEGGLKKLLQTAVAISESRISFYVLTPTFKLINSCVAENQLTRLSRRLSEGGYLSESQINQCFEYVASGEGEDAESAGGKIAYKMYPIKLAHEILGYLLVIGITSFSGYNELISLLTDELAKHMARDGNPIGMSRREMTKILEDIFLFMPENIDELRKRLNNLPNKPKKYIRSVVISFAGEIPLSSVLAELDSIFPTGNAAPYSSHVVVLVSGDNHLFIPEFDKERFEYLLEKHDGHAVISNAGRYLSGLRTLYIQSKDALALLPKLRGSFGNQRCVYFEALREYYIIDLCAKTIAEYYGHDKMVYLAHPAVMELMRYDIKHGTDLRDFLFTYITNDCSILTTSKQLHIHRNTVMYKLRKIQDILGLDLRDFQLRRELVFSCQVMRYTENIQNRKFRIQHEIDE